MFELLLSFCYVIKEDKLCSGTRYRVQAIKNATLSSG